MRTGCKGFIWEVLPGSQGQGMGETGKEEADRRSFKEQVTRVGTWGSIQPGTSGRWCHMSDPPKGQSGHIYPPFSPSAG